MRLTDVYHLAEEYLRLGIVAAGILIGAFCIGYFIVYKKFLHGAARFPLKKVAALAVILCYLTVVFGATMLGRSGTWANTRIVLYPFMSYREAWYSFSIREWRNIILNICMFIPLGLLLPLYGRRWKNAILTYLTGLVFTIAIEFAQLALKRGIFELDDIFNNLLGTMIGYGFYRLLHDVPGRLRPKPQSPYPIIGSANAKPQPLYPTMLYQLPLVFTAILFGAIFTVYQLQEFGNLQEHYIRKADMSAVELQLHTTLSAEPQIVPVYQTGIADESETHALAQDFFERLGTRIDESGSDIYDETAVYWSLGREYSIWIDYAGCPMRFTDFTALKSGRGGNATGKPGHSREEIQAALEPFGIQAPGRAGFQDLGDGKYAFEAAFVEAGNLCQGTLSCTCNADGKIISFENAMITYQKYRDCEILSEQEAYGQLENGMFRVYDLGDGIASISVDAVRLHYIADTKGFYQPVYAFEVTVNGEAAVIEIPALK